MLTNYTRRPLQQNTEDREKEEERKKKARETISEWNWPEQRNKTNTWKW
jgi:hypothetical protein